MAAALSQSRAGFVLAGRPPPHCRRPALAAVRPETAPAAASAAVGAADGHVCYSAALVVLLAATMAGGDDAGPPPPRLSAAFCVLAAAAVASIAGEGLVGPTSVTAGAAAAVAVGLALAPGAPTADETAAAAGWIESETLSEFDGRLRDDD